MPFPPSSQIEKSRTDVKLELLARNRGKKERTEKEEEEEEEVEEEEEEEKGRERRASQLAHTSLAGGGGEGIGEQALYWQPVIIYAARNTHVSLTRARTRVQRGETRTRGPSVD